MKIIVQIGVVFAICLLGEAVARVLPISFPASVISMIILFILLLSKKLKPEHIKQKTNFLLKNMAFFFIPSGVAIMEHYEVLKGSILQLLFVCLITLILTFVATAYTVKAVIMLQNKGRKTNE